MADISNVVTVAILEGGRLAARDNVNVVAILTSNKDVVNSTNRYQVYKRVADVEADFGASSQVAKAAQKFFATSPNAVNFGGLFVVGYWRGTEETTIATAANLKGAELSEVTVVSEMQKISDGSFDIDVDGVTENLTSLDFRSVTSLQDIADVIDDALTGADCTIDELGIVITSKTTGATSTLDYVSEGATGIFIGYVLGLADGTGAELNQGADSETLAVETKVEAASALKSLTNAYGMTFLDKPTSQEALDLSDWSQSNSVMMYDVFSSASNLLLDADNNVVWQITLKGADTYQMFYSKKANRMLAVSAMARVHTTNFRAEKTASTLNLKELSVVAEDYTQTELEACKRVGLSVYTTIKNVPCVLTSGANGFADYRYNIIAYKDALQTDLFNLLKGTPTKLAQTTEDVNKLVAQCEKTTKGFVRAGVFAPGEWSMPDTFGDIDTFKRAIRQNGYYFLAGLLSEQDQADREARNAPVIQGAVKLAGAIHHADIIVLANK